MATRNSSKAIAGSMPTLSGQDPASSEDNSEFTLPEFETTYCSTDHAAISELHELERVVLVLPQFHSEFRVFDRGKTEQRLEFVGSGRGDGIVNPVGLPANKLTGIPASPMTSERKKQKKKKKGTSSLERDVSTHTEELFLRTPQFQQQQQQQGASISAAARVVLDKLLMQKQRPLVAEVDEECSMVESGAARLNTGGDQQQQSAGDVGTHVQRSVIRRSS